MTEPLYSVSRLYVLLSTDAGHACGSAALDGGEVKAVEVGEGEAVYCVSPAVDIVKRSVGSRVKYRRK